MFFVPRSSEFIPTEGLLEFGSHASLRDAHDEIILLVYG